MPANDLRLATREKLLGMLGVLQGAFPPSTDVGRSDLTMHSNTAEASTNKLLGMGLPPEVAKVMVHAGGLANEGTSALVNSILPFLGKTFADRLGIENSLQAYPLISGAGFDPTDVLANDTGINKALRELPMEDPYSMGALSRQAQGIPPARYGYAEGGVIRQAPNVMDEILGRLKHAAAMPSTTEQLANLLFPILAANRASDILSIPDLLGERALDYGVIPGYEDEDNKTRGMILSALAQAAIPAGFAEGLAGKVATKALKNVPTKIVSKPASEALKGITAKRWQFDEINPGNIDDVIDSIIVQSKSDVANPLNRAESFRAQFDRLIKPGSSFGKATERPLHYIFDDNPAGNVLAYNPETKASDLAGGVYYRSLNQLRDNPNIELPIDIGELPIAKTGFVNLPKTMSPSTARHEYMHHLISSLPPKERGSLFNTMRNMQGPSAPREYINAQSSGFYHPSERFEEMPAFYAQDLFEELRQKPQELNVPSDLAALEGFVSELERLGVIPKATRGK